MPAEHILIVDDEPSLVAVLKPVLNAAGYSVTVAADGAGALRAASASPPDVIILDLGLPDVDGKAIIERLRALGDLSIIVISARHQEAEKIAALDEGADDYVNKPFEIGELMARIRVALRRQANLQTAVSSFRSGALAIDFKTRIVTLEGVAIKLSPKEYELLQLLARSAGQVVTHKRLLAAGWGSSTTDTQYLRVYIGLLRQKIEEDPANPAIILTEPGVGYRMVGP